MRLATLITKKVLVATVSVAGVGTSFVLIAPSLGISLFGDDTQVADSTVSQEEPATAPSLLVSPSTANSGFGDSAVGRRSSSSRNASQPAPAPTATPTVAPVAGTDTANTATAPTANNPGGAAGNGSKPGGGTGSQPKPGDGPSQAFEIKGSVSGTLYPTVANELTVKIENPYSFAIEIVSAEVTVGEAGTCSGRHLWINGTQPASNGSVTLPAGQRIAAKGEATYPVTAQLQNSAGDDCQGVTFPLSYLGTAVKP